MDTASKASSKLPMFMPRPVSSTKSTGPPIGTISFNTQNDEDITGLDEAMETFRISAVTNGLQNTKTQLSSSADTKSLNSQTLTELAEALPDFEVAVEATAVAEDSDPNQLNPNIDECPDLAFDECHCTESDNTSETSEATHRTHVEGSSVLKLQANLQSRTASGKSNAVAAADIHALLDSFGPTGLTSYTTEVTQNKPQTELLRDSSPELTDQNLIQNEHASSKEQPTFHVDMETRDVYSADIVAQSGPDDRGLSKLEDLINENVDVTSTRHRGPVATTERVPSLPPGQYAPSPQQMESPGQPKALRQKCTIAIFWPYLVPVSLLLLASLYFLSSFILGLACGVAIVYSFLTLRPMILSDNRETKCPISGFPLGQYCCSLHSQLTRGDVSVTEIRWPIYAPALPPLGSPRGVPQLRDLQSLTVPHMTDEDPGSSAAGGPLGVGLGFKLDKNERPVYKGWMNETTSYDVVTHHVSQTHSVFVTLDGTQLRLQRPRRNIARRSMWNEELPTTSALRFQQQRIFDLVHARVSLLPTGLVSKRLWSKKYPISITIPKKLHGSSGQRQSLPTSTSVPNMMSSMSPTSSPARAEAAVSSVVNDNHSQPRPPTPANVLDMVDDFTILSQHDIPSETLYLFSRTCREKETWYARLRGASLGIPLLWTPQLAVQTYLAATVNGTSSVPTGGNSNPCGDNRSDDEDDETVPDKEATKTVLSSDGWIGGVDKSGPQLPIPGSREPLYVTYVRYMAKYMPASWLLRATQALRLNVNYISCEPHVMWLNALLARVFWDFLREVYWLERVRDKIQAKLKKIHLPPFISDLIVVGIDLGTELPVIRRIGRPFLDAHGLWFELDVAYAGGFSVALETNFNLMRWNQKTRESNMLADDLPSTPPSSTTQTDPNLNAFPRRANRMGAFLSDEEDSVDSTTDSDTVVEPSQLSPSGGGNFTTTSLRRSSGSGRLLASSPGLASLSGRNAEEDRVTGVDSSLNLPAALPSRRRLIRIVDRITRSTYFQKAVDNKLVQRGMELLSNTPIVLEAEVQMLTGTLLVNIPPPPSDRLWYGFRPNPQLRLKARPRVGEKAVTMSRILEWIEKRVVLEFQRLIVLPNMDDISIPLLLSDISAG